MVLYLTTAFGNTAKSRTPPQCFKQLDSACLGVAFPAESLNLLCKRFVQHTYGLSDLLLSCDLRLDSFYQKHTGQDTIGVLLSLYLKKKKMVNNP